MELPAETCLHSVFPPYHACSSPIFDHRLPDKVICTWLSLNGKEGIGSSLEFPITRGVLSQCPAQHKPGVLVDACNLSIREEEKGEPEVQVTLSYRMGQPGIHETLPESKQHAGPGDGDVV